MTPSPSQPLNSAALQQDPLAQLRDIHLPEAISWWPPAYGWWLLAIGLFIVLSIGSFLLYRFWVKRHYRRLALKQLNTIAKQQWDDQRLCLLIAELLRQCAISVGIPAAAKAQGQQWQAILAMAMDKEFALLLAVGRYQQHTAAIDQQALLDAAQQWIKQSMRVKNRLSKETAHAL